MCMCMWVVVLSLLSTIIVLSIYFPPLLSFFLFFHPILPFIISPYTHAPSQHHIPGVSFYLSLSFWYYLIHLHSIPFHHVIMFDGYSINSNSSIAYHTAISICINMSVRMHTHATYSLCVIPIPIPIPISLSPSFSLPSLSCLLDNAHIIWLIYLTSSISLYLYCMYH